MFSVSRIQTIFAAGLLATIGWSGAASAVTLTFENITNNTTDIASQLDVEALDVGSGVQFTFSGGAGLSLSITEIYFDDDTPIFVAPPIEVASSAGVSYEEGGTNNPQNLPGGNGVGFQATTNLVAEASGNNATGINVGEFYTVELVYAAGQDFMDFLASLDDGSFNIGLHVRSIDGGNSDSYVNLPPVPVPAAGFLLIGALGGLVALRRSRKI